MNPFMDMQTFVAVVESQGINKAAHRLGTTKSVVSKRIQQLESRLGVVLLERGHKLGVTEAGQQFYLTSVRLLEDLAESEDAVRSSQATLQGTLRLAVPTAFSILYLAPLLTEFMCNYPELHLDVENSDHTVDLNKENYDMAIRIGPLPDSGLLSRKIACNRHVICASPDYLARRGKPTHPSQLYQHDGLLYLHREPHGMWLLPVGGVLRSFRIGNRLRTDSAHYLLASAKAGLGLAILPVFVAADDIAAGNLRVILPEFSPPGGHISAVYRQSKRALPKVQALINYLVEKIGDPPGWEQKIVPFLPPQRS